MQVIKDDLLHLLVDLLLLPKDHVPLPLDRLALQLAALEDIGDDLDALAHVLAEALGVVDGLLPTGVGVEVSSEVLDLELELVLAPLAGSLERHVLEEVSGSVGRVRLGAGPSIDPDADRGRLGVRVGFGGDGEAVGKGGDLGKRGGDGGSEGAEGSRLRLAGERGEKEEESAGCPSGVGWCGGASEVRSYGSPAILIPCHSRSFQPCVACAKGTTPQSECPSSPHADTSRSAVASSSKPPLLSLPTTTTPPAQSASAPCPTRALHLPQLWLYRLDPFAVPS